MTAAIEYMKKQLQKHKRNYLHEVERGASEEILQNINNKICYYAAAIIALENQINKSIKEE